MSTRRHHQANEGKSGLEAESVRALGALHSLRSKKQLAAEKRQKTHILIIKEKQQWIQDFVERETAVARKRVQGAETVIMQDITTAETLGATTRKSETTFEVMLNTTIGESLSDLASSDNEQDREDQEDGEEDTELSKLSDDDELGWVMGTISKTAQHHMQSFRQ